jgi:PAS domain S-box-containing protein
MAWRSSPETPVGSIRWGHFGKPSFRLVACIAAVFAVTAALYAVPLERRPLSSALAFLFVELLVAAAWGFRYALFVSFLAALGFSWLLSPIGRFWLSDPRDVLVLAALLVIGITTSRLSDRARREALNANQRRAEAVAAQQRFADLVNSVESIVWEADAQTFAFSFVSEQAERILGYPAEQWLSEPAFWKDHLHPEDRDLVVQFCAQVTAQKRTHDFEYRMIAADGRVVWLRNLVTVVTENGRATHLRGVMIDVTERNLTQEALRRSEAYLAEAQRLAHTGSWAFDPATAKSIYWSEEMFRIFGLDPQQGPPTSEVFRELVHPEDRDSVYQLMRKAALEKTEYEHEHRIVLPDGTVRHIHAIGHPVLDRAGNTVEFVGTAVDVTERKRAEAERERLRQLERDLAHINRVSMLGELAASLAHEIKQPIAAAVTNANTSLRWLARDEPDLVEAREAIMRIVKDGTRAADIINRLRSFYEKGAPPQPELVDLNEVAREMLMLLRNDANRYTIAMRTELAPELPRVLADRVQLQQVFMNLMLNAIEAMKDTAGELTIKSQSANGGQLLISVSDTGVGLPADGADRIFNAFFTTKPQGTGMGLAITRSIIEAHGGRLWASANTGPGATFHFTLPNAATATVSSTSAG